MYTHIAGKEIAKMPDKEIIDHVKGLYDSIYVSECYGSKDLPLLGDLMAVLQKRGYEINDESRLSITKG